MAAMQANFYVNHAYSADQIGFNAAQTESTFHKDHFDIEVREAAIADSLALQHLLNQLDYETPYLGLMPGERTPQTWEIQRRIIADPSEHSGAIFLACHGKELIGFVQAKINPLRRYCHILDIEIGIRQQFTGKGIGKRLFGFLEIWALEKHIRRLELVVETHNERALTLYKKCGFRIEGIRHEAMLVEDHFADEYLMSKLLT